MAQTIRLDSETRRTFLISLTALTDGAQSPAGRRMAGRSFLTVLSLALGVLVVTAIL
ncbi:MAG: hypothetical protein WD652_03580 [Acidimicrobiia bacterium]